MPKKPLPTTPAPVPRLSNDLLGTLGDREGWDAAPGSNGWHHPALDITVRCLGPMTYTVEHDGVTRQLTSANGALLVVDQISAKVAAG